MQKRIITGTLWGLLVLFSFSSCSKDKEVPPAAVNQKINTRLYEYFNEAYLWNTRIPSYSSLNNTLEPVDYFEKLRYLPDDKWSALFRDSEQINQLLANEGQSFGYGLAFGAFSNSNTYFAVITHVYPKSPAAQTGLKRGDLIMALNGAAITDANANDLFYASSLTLTLGKITNNVMDIDRNVSLQASTQYNDPVVATRVLEYDSQKIGYLCYTDYVESSESRLTEVFTGFKEAGVTDVVLDLRYNGGGMATTGVFLSSILAPETALDGQTLFLTESWNDFYNQYFDESNYNRQQYFKADIPVKMNLNRLYILTTGNTASASEATIIGLRPYMEVVTIGTPTHGKYCGAGVIDALDEKDEDLKQWGMMLVVYKFINSEGLTDFKDGLMPTWTVEDDLLNAYPLGDEHDPQLAKAIQLITGNAAPAAASPLLKAPAGVRLLNKDKDFRHPVKKNMISRFPARNE